MKSLFTMHLHVCTKNFWKVFSIFITCFFISVTATFAQTISLLYNGGPCPGDTKGFRLNGATLVSWDYSGSPTVISQNATDIFLKWNTPGTYYIAALTTTGNVVYPNFQVASSITPTVSVARTAGALCQGSSITFTATAATTPSSSLTYIWKVDGTTVPGQTSSTYTTTASLSGSHTVACHVTSSFSCATVGVGSTTINVPPAPSFTLAASPNPICSGTSTTITATGNPTSYVWTAPGGFYRTTTTPSITVKPTATTTYTVYGETAFNCSAQQTITVTVNATSGATGSPCSPPPGTSGGTFAGTSNSRYAIPVIIKASNAPQLNNYNSADLVGFIYNSASSAANKWEQIPIQVDEKKMVDAGTIYNTSTVRDSYSYDFFGYNTNDYGREVDQTKAYYSTFTSAQFCDAGTFVGADPDALFDYDSDQSDELVFMARDAGADLPPSNAPYPLGVTKSAGAKITITDPLNSSAPASYVFIFKRSGTMDQSAGKYYVNYAFNLASGDYINTYHLNGHQDGNLETSVVTTPFYSTGFSHRWIQDKLYITNGSSSSRNMLERSKVQIGRTDPENEQWFGFDEGAFISNKNGPIRGIRSFMGAESGPLTQREHLFYDKTEVITTYLRVHNLCEIMDFYDYNDNPSNASVNPGPGTMLYNNNRNTNAVVTDPVSGLTGRAIDGSPDAITQGSLEWELINSNYGSIFRYYYLSAPDFASILNQNTYYLDDSTPDPATDPQFESQSGGTVNGVAFGASGIYFNQCEKYDNDPLNTDTDPNNNIPERYRTMPNSDPRNVRNSVLSSTTPPSTFYFTYDVNKAFMTNTLTKVNMYLQPNTSLSAVPGLKDKITTPLTAQLSAWSTTNMGNFSVITTYNEDIPVSPEVSVFPNPSGGVVTLDIKAESSQKVDIVIYNNSGQKIYAKKHMGSLNQVIDLQAPAGHGQLYIAKITIDGKKYDKKILVNK